MHYYLPETKRLARRVSVSDCDAPAAIERVPAQAAAGASGVVGAGVSRESTEDCADCRAVIGSERPATAASSAEVSTAGLAAFRASISAWMLAKPVCRSAATAETEAFSLLIAVVALSMSAAAAVDCSDLTSSLA